MNQPLAALRGRDYLGRIILIGLDRSGEKVAVAYAITGRSASSRARRLRLKGKSIWTEPTQREILSQGKEELLLYRAMAIGRAIVVSNGKQTDDIFRAVGRAAEPRQILKIGLEGWSYESDAPHFTPRLAGCVLPDGKACLAIIKKKNQTAEERSFYPWLLAPGEGKMIATYAGEEKHPLPSFDRDPLDIEISSPKAEALARALYDSLAPRGSAPDHRVAVACVFAPMGNFNRFEIEVINKNER